METLTRRAKGFLDEAERVRCPHCNAPMLSFLVGVMRIVCRVCKGEFIISKNEASLVQSHTTLREGKETKRGWWRDDEKDPMSFVRT